MKILFVNEKWGLSGGQEEYIRVVCNALVGRGHEVHLLYGELSGHTVDSEKVKFKQILVKDLELDKVEDWAKKIGPDVINLQNVYEPRLVNKLNQNFPTTRFVHDHSTYCPGNSKYFFRSGKICTIAASYSCLLNAYKEKCMTRRPSLALKRVRGRFEWLEALKGLSLVLCNSSYVKTALVMNGLVESKVVVNHLFPGHSESFYEAEPINILEPGPAQILYVGRLFKEKGVDVLLKAVSQIKQDFRLKIVGEGWEKDNLLKLSLDLGLEEKVEFLGFKNGVDLARLYKSCLFFVMPSVWPEPFGMVGIEANAFSKAVVAFNVGGVTDWLEDNVNGVLLGQVDVHGLAETMESLLNNRVRCRALGLAGLNKVKTRFNLERHLDVLEEVYTRIKR